MVFVGVLGVAIPSEIPTYNTYADTASIQPVGIHLYRGIGRVSA